MPHPVMYGTVVRTLTLPNGGEMNFPSNYTTSYFRSEVLPESPILPENMRLAMARARMN